MLQQIADNTWEFSYPAKLGPGITFPCRTTIVRTDDATIVYSPGPFPQSVVDEIRGWNKQVLLVAPNLFHHFHFQAAREQFPDALAFGPTGLARKNRTIRDGFRPCAELRAHLPAALTALTLPGAPKIDETVLYDARSQSLIVCDAFFNMRSPQPLLTSSVLRMTGTYDCLAQSRLFRFFVKDKPTFGAILSECLDRPIDRIVPAHGAIATEIDQARSIAQP